MLWEMLSTSSESPRYSCFVSRRLEPSLHNLLTGTLFILAENIIISDISSLRNRVLMTILPNTLPGLLNLWVAGDVAASILAKGGWRWGIGKLFGGHASICKA